MLIFSSVFLQSKKQVVKIPELMGLRMPPLVICSDTKIMVSTLTWGSYRREPVRPNGLNSTTLRQMAWGFPARHLLIGTESRR